MSDRPWMKFYPRDWRGDQALRVVSLAARGLWIEMISVMHESSPYGHLLIGGQPVGDGALARLVGATVEEVQALLVELRNAGVFRQTRVGVIYSKRMTDDHKRSLQGRKDKKTALDEAAEKQGENLRPSRVATRDPRTHIPEARVQLELVTPTSEKPEPQQSGEVSPSRGSRLKPDWQPSADNLAYAVAQGYSLAEVSRIAEDFRDFWSAKAGKDASKLDWTATWRRWVREEGKRRLRGRQAGPQRRVGFV